MIDIYAAIDYYTGVGGVEWGKSAHSKTMEEPAREERSIQLAGDESSLWPLVTVLFDNIYRQRQRQRLVLLLATIRCHHNIDTPTVQNIKEGGSSRHPESLINDPLLCHPDNAITIDPAQQPQQPQGSSSSFSRLHLIVQRD